MGNVISIEVTFTKNVENGAERDTSKESNNIEHNKPKDLKNSQELLN